MAVLPVVVNHAGLPGAPGGFVGVDIFFVVSGFLITGILAREIADRRFSILGFYERRARRILPALFFVLATCLVGGWFLLSPERYNGLAGSALATLVFGSNIWFWRKAGDYFGTDVEYEALLHPGSLAVEEQFYVFFPLLLWLLATRRRWVWVACVGLLSAASLALSIWMTEAAPVANFYLLPSRIWELGVGALLALGVTRGPGLPWLREAAGWAGLGLILASIALIDAQTPFPGFAALPPVLGTALIIHAGHHTDAPSRVSRILSWAPFVWVGLISYSLYLWHWPVIVAARYLTDSAHLEIFVALICVVLATALAWASWRYVERPFRARAGPRAIPAAGILAGSALGASMLAAMAVTIWLMDGRMGQTDPERMAIHDAAIARSALEIDCMAAQSCAIGMDEITPSIVIWGDSHAGAMLSGFDTWLRMSAQRGAAGYAFVKSACAPLLGVRRADQAVAHDCDGHNARVLERIAGMPDVTRVILAGRWALNVEGTRAPNEPGRPVVLAKSGAFATETGNNANLFEAGFERLVMELQGMGLQVIVIRSLPEIGRHVPNLILDHGAGLNGRGYLPDRAQHASRNQRADAIFDRIADRYDLTLLDPAELLCSTGTCQVETNLIPLYRDDDHLSVYGAEWLLSRLLDGI